MTGQIFLSQIRKLPVAFGDYFRFSTNLFIRLSGSAARRYERKRDAMQSCQYKTFSALKAQVFEIYQH